MNYTWYIFIGVFGVIYLGWWGVLMHAVTQSQSEDQLKRAKKKLDERQLAEQGRAYRYAWAVLVGYLVLWAFGDMLGVRWFDPAFGAFLGAGLSAAVWLAYAVVQDALWGDRKTKQAEVLSLNVGGVCMLMIGASGMAAGKQLLVDGAVTWRAIPLIFVGLVVLMDVFLLLRRRMERAAGKG